MPRLGLSGRSNRGRNTGLKILIQLRRITEFNLIGKGALNFEIVFIFDIKAHKC